MVASTIDPESLVNMLKLTMLSPAMSLVAASTPSQAAAASSEKREPGDAAAPPSIQLSSRIYWRK